MLYIADIELIFYMFILDINIWFLYDSFINTKNVSRWSMRQLLSGSFLLDLSVRSNFNRKCRVFLIHIIIIPVIGFF